MFYTYVILNKLFNKIYIGHTSDLHKRLERHNGITKNKITSYTARFKGGWVIIYKKEFNTRNEAIRREKELKSYQGRKFIKNLIK